MQEIMSYHVVPPGNLSVRQEGGLIRRATDLETIHFVRMGVCLSSRYDWKTPRHRSAPITDNRALEKV